MICFGKKSGFTLSEILVTLGLIGVISALTIPNLAYNYRAKVLEEQFRSTYNDIKQVGSMLNYEKGDVGLYANKISWVTWQEEIISRIHGGNNLLNTTDHNNISNELRRIYREGGGSPGPYRFNLSGDTGTRIQTGIHCDNGSIWLDSKGRIWTFNAENRMICVDINGAANPNRLNIDIFAFIPMSAEQVAVWVYDDAAHPNNYSGAIIPCDLDVIQGEGLSNAIPEKPYEKKPPGQRATAFDACPFNEPIENVAAMHGVNPGKSAKNKDVAITDNYWKKYIEYK